MKRNPPSQAGKAISLPLFPRVRLRPSALTFWIQPAARMVCWHTVKRTTVKLPDELDARLRHEAARRGLTVSEITREAIESHLGGNRRRLIGAKAGRSGTRDTARKIEQILRREARR